MAGIMKKLRNETERAKFEAARALRLQREQGKLGQLQNQRKDHVSVGRGGLGVVPGRPGDGRPAGQYLHPDSCDAAGDRYPRAGN